MPIFGVRNSTLNQYLGTMNYNMDKNLCSGSTNLKKEESWNMVRVSKILDSIFGVPKTLGLIFRGQERNSGMEY